MKKNITAAFVSILATRPDRSGSRSHTQAQDHFSVHVVEI